MLLVCAINLLTVVRAARILGIVALPSYSHQVVFQPLWRELSIRGHQVTTLTTDPINDPKLTNLTEIDLHFAYETWNKDIMVTALKFQGNSIGLINNLMKQAFDVIDEELRHPKVQALIHGDDEFDLVIIEVIALPFLPFAAKFKCPVINIISLDMSSRLHQLMGNPTHPILYPDVYYPYDEHLTFRQRLTSVIITCLMNVNGIHAYLAANSMAQKYFGPNYPSLVDIIYNVSMIFVNTDPILHRVRPFVPTVVQIGGGSHLKPARLLPTDLQELLDNAESGFIYFSLGSNVKSKDIPIDLRETILETFAELPYMVLWKFEAENLPNRPKNVFISKWLPQQDVLRHRNIKLFVTQGGLQSMEEAVYSGVPMVVMPFFADQGYNAKAIVYKGMGLSVDYANLKKEEFRDKVLEVIREPRYRNRVKELARLALDQPMTGMERAVWWTEYVIRHKGAEHLNSPIKDFPWYKYLLLDVLVVLVASLMVVVGGVYCALRTVWIYFRRNRKDKEKKTK
ncbi:UDP-glucuronosyltransferase 2B1-like isoform X2 [Photinus pyralis]|nr:UDP-glucuronosyltransferase 2B1-like isoform X2 [Photinus pyralis]